MSDPSAKGNGGRPDKEKLVSPRGYQFGAFKGVFTPSILTILGVIMYLRFGWVLGNVGLPLTLIIVTLATAVTFLTGLSLSATATNMHIGGGGAYYIISRSLGIEVGAAIGLPLFLAQALGVAFYISGFAEASVGWIDVSLFTDVLPFEISEARLIAVLTLVLLTMITYVSADLALKTQLLILFAIGASLISFFLGRAPMDLEVPAEVPAVLPFWAVFAVFFPAVTGIEAGISMSGDLKEPAKALPRGTLAAVGTGYLVYILIPLYLSFRIADSRLLLAYPMIMSHVARWAPLILAGVWAATLSSAMGALLGAPRTLQALSRDRVVPRLFGRGYGPTNDPRLATVATFLMALVGILLGDLNLIAPILSMFFLTSYGLINLSSGLEGLIDSPFWRPTFKVRPWVSLLGAALCFGIMLMIDAGATLTALAVTGGVYAVMKRRRLNAQWGDMRYGILMLMANFAIRRLSERDPGERTWRPNILVLSGPPQSRWYLIELAHAMVPGGRGMTVGTVIPAAEWAAEKVRSLQKTIEEYLLKREVAALVKVVPAEDMLVGAEALVKAYGFGPITPNTVLMGESEVQENIERFAGLIQLIHRLGRNLVLVREAERRMETGAEPTLDIWWRGKHSNIGLMLTLAHLLRRSGAWEGARIRIKKIAKDEREGEDIREALEAYIREQRLEVDLELVMAGGRPVPEVIRESSREASLVLLGMRVPEPKETPSEYADYYRHLLEATEGLPTAHVLAAGQMNFRKIVGLG